MKTTLRMHKHNVHQVTLEPAAVPRALKSALVLALKKSRRPRGEMALLISEMIEKPITIPMLNKYVSVGSEAHRISAEVIPAFCLVTGSRGPLDILAAAIGCTLVGPEESRELEITRLRLDKTKLERKIKELERGR